MIDHDIFGLDRGRVHIGIFIVVGATTQQTPSLQLPLTSVPMLPT